MWRDGRISLITKRGYYNILFFYCYSFDCSYNDGFWRYWTGKGWKVWHYCVIAKLYGLAGQKRKQMTVLHQIKCDNRLLRTIYDCQLTLFSYRFKHNSLEKTLWHGTRKVGVKGISITGLRDHIKEIRWCTLLEITRFAQDQNNWRKFVTEPSSMLLMKMMSRRTRQLSEKQSIYFL